MNGGIRENKGVISLIKWTYEENGFEKLILSSSKLQEIDQKCWIKKVKL